MIFDKLSVKWYLCVYAFILHSVVFASCNKPIRESYNKDGNDSRGQCTGEYRKSVEFFEKRFFSLNKMLEHELSKKEIDFSSADKIKSKYRKSYLGVREEVSKNLLNTFILCDKNNSYKESEIKEIKYDNNNEIQRSEELKILKQNKLENVIEQGDCINILYNKSTEKGQSEIQLTNQLSISGLEQAKNEIQKNEELEILKEFKPDNVIEQRDYINIVGEEITESSKGQCMCTVEEIDSIELLAGYKTNSCCFFCHCCVL